MAGNILIVFSYTPNNDGLTQAPQHIELQYAVFVYADRAAAEAAMEVERDTPGRHAQSRLCKPDQAAIAAKVAKFSEELSWDYRSIDGEMAVVTLAASGPQVGEISCT